MIQAVARGGLGHHWADSRRRAHQQRAGALLHDQKSASSGALLRATVRRGGTASSSRGDAVQVRVHGDHGVEQAGRKGPPPGWLTAPPGWKAMSGAYKARWGATSVEAGASPRLRRTARGEQQLDEFSLGWSRLQQHGAGRGPAASTGR